MRLALDTNILAYAEGVDGADRRGAALDLIQRLPQEKTVIPVQALGELFNMLVRKAGRSRAKARDALERVGVDLNRQGFPNQSKHDSSLRPGGGWLGWRMERLFAFG